MPLTWGELLPEWFKAIYTTSDPRHKFISLNAHSDGRNVYSSKLVRSSVRQYLSVRPFCIRLLIRWWLGKGIELCSIYLNLLQHLIDNLEYLSSSTFYTNFRHVLLQYYNMVKMPLLPSTVFETFFITSC